MHQAPPGLDICFTLSSLQVSNQCMALVGDNCLVPTIDEPGLGYMPKSSSDHYVSDVFYKVGTKHELHCNET